MEENHTNENRTNENPAIENPAIENIAIENIAIENTAIENTAIENTAIENTAIENRIDEKRTEEQYEWIRKSKKEYRKYFRKLRDQLSPEEVETKSEVICRKIAELPEFIEADAILSYMAFRNEVDMKYIMSTARGLGKKIFLPRMDGEDMEFHLAEGKEELVKNSLGILEPDPGSPMLPDVMPKGSKLLMLMPGLAYDRSHHRLGYGGGYYDRYLAGICDGYLLTTVAPTYVVLVKREGELPCEDTDIRPQMIIDESDE